MHLFDICFYFISFFPIPIYLRHDLYAERAYTRSPVSSTSSPLKFHDKEDTSYEHGGDYSRYVSTKK